MHLSLSTKKRERVGRQIWRHIPTDLATQKAEEGKSRDQESAATIGNTTALRLKQGGVQVGPL